MSIDVTTPGIPGMGLARANLVWDADARKELLDGDWRAPELPYMVPAGLRLKPRREDGGGAPSECTEALCQRIERLVLTGCSVQAAKTSAGVTRDRWKRWTDKARHDIQPYWQMMERMRLATSHKEAAAARVLSAASEHPDAGIATKAALKVLEHTNPAKYAPQSRQKVDVKLSGHVNVAKVSVLAEFSADDIAKLLQARASGGYLEQKRELSAASLFEAAPVVAREEDEEG